MKNNKFINEIEDYLLSYWYGKQKLWKAFWLMGFVFQIVIYFFLYSILYIGTKIGLTWSIKIIIFLISNIYTIWILVSIWKCAYNVKDKIWGIVSRAIVILNIIFILLVYSGFVTFNYQAVS